MRADVRMRWICKRVPSSKIPSRVLRYPNSESTRCLAAVLRRTLCLAENVAQTGADTLRKATFIGEPGTNSEFINKF